MRAIIVTSFLYESYGGDSFDEIDGDDKSEYWQEPSLLLLSYARAINDNFDRTKGDGRVKG